MLLFVYGTLKRGYANHYLLGESSFLGEAKTEKGSYRLYEIQGGNFPVLIASPSTYAVQGELYDVSEDTLQILDILEGVGSGFYQRVFIQLEEADLPVIAYLWQKSVHTFQELTSGNWPENLPEQIEGIEMNSSQK